MTLLLFETLMMLSSVILTLLFIFIYEKKAKHKILFIISYFIIAFVLLSIFYSLRGFVMTNILLAYGIDPNNILNISQESLNFVNIVLYTSVISFTIIYILTTWISFRIIFKKFFLKNKN